MTCKKFLTTLSLVALLPLVIGCNGLPLNADSTNSNLFENRSDFKVRCAMLESKMSPETAFSALDVSEESFTTLKPVEIQQFIYGRSEVRGTPDQLEEFRVRMAAYEGFKLPYSTLQRSGKLGLGKVIIDETGWDQTLVLIFDDGELFKSMVVGRAEVDKSSSNYLWEFVGSAIKKGGKLALK